MVKASNVIDVDSVCLKCIAPLQLHRTFHLEVFWEKQGKGARKILGISGTKENRKCSSGKDEESEKIVLFPEDVEKYGTNTS